jgi:hypothetical protein
MSGRSRIENTIVPLIHLRGTKGTNLTDQASPVPCWRTIPVAKNRPMLSLPSRPGVRSMNPSPAALCSPTWAFPLTIWSCVEGKNSGSAAKGLNHKIRAQSDFFPLQHIQSDEIAQNQPFGRQSKPEPTPNCRWRDGRIGRERQPLMIQFSATVKKPRGKFGAKFPVPSLRFPSQCSPGLVSHPFLN